MGDGGVEFLGERNKCLRGSSAVDGGCGGAAAAVAVAVVIVVVALPLAFLLGAVDFVAYFICSCFVSV